MVGRAAEIAQARGRDGVRQADRLAAVEVLGRRIGRVVAALDQDDAAASAGQRQRQYDAAGAGADDAEIGVEPLLGRQAARVDEHRLRPSAPSSARSAEARSRPRSSRRCRRAAPRQSRWQPRGRARRPAPARAAPEPLPRPCRRGRGSAPRDRRRPPVAQPACRMAPAASASSGNSCDKRCIRRSAGAGHRRRYAGTAMAARPAASAAAPRTSIRRREAIGTEPRAVIACPRAAPSRSGTATPSARHIADGAPDGQAAAPFDAIGPPPPARYIYPMPDLAIAPVLQRRLSEPPPGDRRQAVQARLRPRPAGDQPQAIAELIDGLERRRARPGAARRHRLGQDLHHGACHRSAAAAGADPGAEQDAGGAALRRDEELLPGERGRVFRLLLRLLPARGLRRRAPTPISRRNPRSTSRSTACATRRPGRCSSGATSIIVASVSCIYGIGSPETYSTDDADAASAARRSTAPSCCARLVELQYQRNDADFLRGAFRVARRHDRDLPGASTRTAPGALAVRRRDRGDPRVRPADRREDRRRSTRSRSTPTATT